MVVLNVNFSILGIFCDKFPTKNTLNVEYSNPLITVDTLATFSCRPGYELVGSETATCGESGTWSNQMPRCEGKFFIIR